MSGSPDKSISLDRPALEGLWRRERRWVAAVLLAHKPASVALEDLLQDVALKLVQHASDVRSPEALPRWLRTVARNAAVEAGRRDSRAKARGVNELDPNRLIDPNSETSTHELGVESALDRVMVWAESLPPLYREPLLLRCVHGMSQRRIAELLDVTESTIETRLSRARRRLRERAEGVRISADGEPE